MRIKLIISIFVVCVFIAGFPSRVDPTPGRIIEPAVRKSVEKTRHPIIFDAPTSIAQETYWR